MRKHPRYRKQRQNRTGSLFVAGAVVVTFSMVAGCGVNGAGAVNQALQNQSNRTGTENSLTSTKSSVSNQVASDNSVAALGSQSGSGNQNGSAAQNSATPGDTNAATGGAGENSTGNSISGSNVTQTSTGKPQFQVQQIPLTALSAYPSQVVPSFSPSSLQFVDQEHGFVAGGGYLYATNDGGHSFQQLYHFSGDVLKADFVSLTTGFALVASGTSTTGQPTGIQLWTTTDGGAKWSPCKAASGTPFADLAAGQQVYMHFTDAKNGTISLSGTNQQTTQGKGPVQASIYVTTDGGSSWTKRPSPPEAQAVAYADASHGVALVSNKTSFSLEWTRDGGRSWSTVYQKSFGFEVTGRAWMTGPTDAYVQVYGGYGMTQQSYTLFHTGDSGQTWNTLIASATGGGGPAPGVVNAGPSTAGPGLIPGSLDVLSGKTAILPGVAILQGPSGLVYVGETQDGVHWENSQAHMPGQAGIVSFITPSTGWLITSTDKQFADVFKTTDGGTTWQPCYQFVLGQSAVQSGRVTPLTYTQQQLQQIHAVAQTDGVSLYLPTAGLDNEQFSIVKTNGDGSVGLVYNHIWVIESNQPIPQPVGGSEVASFDEKLTDGTACQYTEMYNTEGQLNKFLYFKIGDTYVSITYLQQDSPYNDREFVQIAESFARLQDLSGETS